MCRERVAGSPRSGGEARRPPEFIGATRVIGISGEQPHICQKKANMGHGRCGYRSVVNSGE